MQRLLFALSTVALLAAGFGCDIDGQQLLQNYRDGELLPADVIDLDQEGDRPDLETGTYIGEVGPSHVGQGQISGATLTILGTGERICVIVDPQSVFRDDLQLDAAGTEGPNPLMNDFSGDDGDIDLLAGLASYYTGTPGEAIGDFVNDFPDDNGVNRRVDLNLCLLEDYFGQVGGTAGRATPEWCDFPTLLDTEYRIVLQVFSVPVDDNLLKYALQIREGSCPSTVDECTLRGDADNEDGLPGGFEDVEEMYCSAADR